MFIGNCNLTNKVASAILYLPPLFLYFLMMFVPQTYQEIKYVLVLMSLFCMSLILKPNKIYYSKRLIQWFFFYILFYLIWIFRGSINGSMGVLDLVRVQVVWPFLYLALFIYINSISKIYVLLKVMIIAAFFISMYNIYRVTSAMGIIPQLIELDDDFVIGFHAGFTQITTLNINSLVYLLPFVLCLAATGSNLLNKVNISNTFIMISTIISFGVAILSGRRVFILILIMNFIIIFPYLWYMRETRLLIKYTLIILITISAFAPIIAFSNEYLGLEYAVIKERFLEELEPSSQTPRNEQKEALIRGFSKKPILGTGLGIGVKDVVRSGERDWTYELTYHLYLYNTGVIGMIIFLSLLIYPIFWSINLSNIDPNISHILFPIMIGYISAVIASATNPIITSSFDLQWMLFLPIGILNCLEINLLRKYRTIEIPLMNNKAAF